MSRWAVVVPTNRPEKLEAFLEAWKPLFSKHDVVLHVCVDAPRDGAKADSGRATVYHWDDIPDWVPRRTDMIRSWGIYQAWAEQRSEFTLSLDDDTLPNADPFAAYEDTFRNGAPVSPYLNVGALTTFEKPLRGFPYRDRERKPVAVQYGGWHGVLDYDAPTQLAGVNDSEWFERVVLPVPRGAAVTGCIMNAAWRTEYAPIMWQLPMLDGRYNRFGDIWAGLFAKKTLDAVDAAMVINGRASVRHERASDPIQNLAREAPGIPVNEGIWAALYARPPFTDDVSDELCDRYRYVTDSAVKFFKRHDHDYAKHFLDARNEWLRLFT